MIFKLRFTTHFVISLISLGLATHSLAADQVRPQPSYGDNPNLIRVLAYKTKQNLPKPSQLFAKLSSSQSQSQSQSQKITTPTTPAITSSEAKISHLPLTLQQPTSTNVTSETQPTPNVVAPLAPISNNIYIPELVDLSNLSAKQPRIIIEQIPTEIEDDYFKSASR